MCSACLTLVCLLTAPLCGQNPLDSVKDPGANRKDEPLAEYSLDRAVGFLDAASLSWQKKRKCFTCHTNFAYLYARPAAETLAKQDAAAHATVRAFAEELVTRRWPDKGPRWDAEVVAAAAALAFNDRATTGKLHPVTRTALDRMWTLQQSDGGWDWLKCGWPPMESDDHYGVTLAALAVGVAPSKYAETEAAKRGMEKIREYLKNNPPPTLHHGAMLLWANSYQALMPPDDVQKVQRQLLALQRPNGGWALASLGDWKRGDGSEQEKTTSDGYGTGFVVYVLLRSGLPAEHPALKKGVAWLKENQRESGRWWTRSLHTDGQHFITHAGTAMAVLAIAEQQKHRKAQ